MVFLSESVGTKSSVSQPLFLAVGSSPRGFAAFIGVLRRVAAFAAKGLGSEEVLIGFNGALCRLFRFLEREGQFAARSVEVTSAVEELFRHAVAGEIIDRAERHPHHVTFRVFPQVNAELHAFHL